jgi:replicative DNA helicase
METAKIYQLIPSSVAEAAQTTTVDASNYESTLISYLLQDPAGMSELNGRLAADDFDQTTYRIIFASAERLHGRNEPIELASVAIDMERSGDLARLTGGLDTLRSLAGAGLFGDIVTKSAAIRVADQIIERSRRRCFIETARKLLELADDYTKPLSVLCAAAEEALGKVAYTSANDGGIEWPQALRKAVEQDVARMEARAEGREIGLSYGLIDLDKMLGFAQPGQFIVVAGRPAMGKTAMLLTMALSMARSRATLIFSMEMSPEQLGNRALSGDSGVDAGSIRDGSITQDQLKMLLYSESKLGTLPIRIDDRSCMDVGYIISACRQYRAKHGEIVVFIDYLQLMDFGTASLNMSVAVGLVTKRLKALARELQCPVICLSQLNRGVEKQADKRPNLADLKESGAIEQDADAVIMLYRDDYYNKDTTDPGICELIVAKNREGQSGTVKTVFDGSHGRFKNLIKFGGS